ncbi:MAG: helix-turn-helix transcriptional regulator [Flavobacteriales bacterium]|nr:helix-turn-helix transcriptional regulator [Flavobacteriia bacterium]NCP06277.1 helix-turn-helix transcriptional regulator [Flavobacteriales bacterium]PIV95047.1 MAG: AraC family transcriptional regulator [Flavobacteriaceae bacterium CG17_big_fil_post_rev_8_21_14_2_50_33_15]PIY11504.1 MAG: AraC family transcriptional regulator [Flavobacteriaceae bacterium CG_4_10_14_3_um_filter_33_47]PJB17054.1 MAG: AraC family transcriptional regulator [Flavobacteriaceae bacterium CG_4_9_14_3_um_filter_33_1
MKLFLKFDFNTLSKKVLESKLDEQNLEYKILGFGEIELIKKLTPEDYDALQSSLHDYGIEIVESQKSILVQKIKDMIINMVFNENIDLKVKSSVYLSKNIGHSYGYLSNLFSEMTYSSIGNFIIIQKIEYVKHLILNTELNLTEIAFKLNYSSVAHLSTQFKNATGITPSAFQRIIFKRRKLAKQKTK